MRRALVAGLVLVIVAVAGRAGWRTPTAALVRLKLVLDRHDLAGVMAAVDTHALADQALVGLLEEPSGGGDRVRLVAGGDGAWLPAIASARDYLRLRIERDVARLVENPEHTLPVSWSDLRRALGTLRRSGAVARFVFEPAGGPQYGVRLRWGGRRWRIVAVERDGVGLLRTGPPLPARPACDCDTVNAHAVPATPPAPAGEERFEPAEPLPLAKPVVLSPPSPRPRRRSPRRPFARRMTNGSWAVQVASTTDAVEAELERDWLAGRGEPAFVVRADVGGRTWQRVLVGRYETRREAEASLARLRALDAAVP